MKAAIFIRDLHDGPFKDGRKHQALYRLTEPMTYPVFDEDCLEREEVVWHVMVSAVDCTGSTRRTSIQPTNLGLSGCASLMVLSVASSITNGR